MITHFYITGINIQGNILVFVFILIYFIFHLKVSHNKTYNKRVVELIVDKILFIYSFLTIRHKKNKVEGMPPRKQRTYTINDNKIVIDKGARKNFIIAKSTHTRLDGVGGLNNRS